MTTKVDIAAQVAERPATALDDGFFRVLFVADRLPELLLALPREQAEAMAADQFRFQTAGYAAQYPGASHRVVLWRDRPVGRVIDVDLGTHLVLVDIVLDPSARGLGIGTEVVQRLQGRARDAGVPVRLHAVLGSPALRLYESLGFLVVGDDGLRAELVWTP